MVHDLDESAQPVGLAPIGTTILWTGCLAVGMAGILMPVIPRAPAPKTFAPVQATLIHVELRSRNSPAPAPSLAAHPAPAESAPNAPPPPPALAAVAAPTAAVAFALPTSGPTQVVAIARAAPAQAPDPNAKPTIQRLTYGQGEGDQPAPEYPLEADLAGQHGSILVRFTVGEDGRVTSAEAIKPCPYPLLNQSAVRTIREEWRFKPGPVRVDEIIIEFKRKDE
jgi:protein TonB